MPMICLLLLYFSKCNIIATLTLLTLAVGFNGATYAGYMNSHLDIAPNYAGTLMGITNCVATTPGFLAPMVVGLFINGHETLMRWQIVFWIACGVYFITNTFYVIFVSGEIQPWNYYGENLNSIGATGNSTTSHINNEKTENSPLKSSNSSYSSTEKKEPISEVF